ncbi:hypothetical protein [Epilithonimonas sp.]|uniref:hypothetical protein n=1 Tax=Epilithonimonas sp. TaxID=2894511 RepID=UPI00289BFDE8|nr:hypothetical protein [Epilithonimonas sp.]
MINKIKRDICIIKYRSLPLFEYDKKTDSEVFYYPTSKSVYWIKLENSLDKKLTSQFLKLITTLDINKLIIFGGCNKPWISKFISKRKDYKPLIRTLEYFKSLEISTKFNGGLEIDVQDLKNFLPHFYTITQCDGGFWDFHMIDQNQNIIFHIHYSGDIQIITLNKKFDKKISNQIKNTVFVDAMRENSDRLNQ